MKVAGSITVTIRGQSITYRIPPSPKGVWLTVRTGPLLTFLSVTRDRATLERHHVKLLSKTEKKVLRTVVGKKANHAHPKTPPA